jgi:hypothetical protein
MHEPDPKPEANSIHPTAQFQGHNSAEHVGLFPQWHHDDLSPSVMMSEISRHVPPVSRTERSRFAHRRKRMAAERTLFQLPDQHLVLVQDPEATGRVAFPVPTLDDGLECRKGQDVFETQGTFRTHITGDDWYNSGVFPLVPNYSCNGRRLDDHPDSFQDP